MRHIGTIPDETQARVFSDFLVASGVPNEIEREAGIWTVWIKNDDHVASAQDWLTKFRANPAAPEFQRATTEAARVRKAAAEDLAAYHRRIRSRRALFPKFSKYGIGVLTCLLIAICVVVFFYSNQGENDAALRPLLITDPLGLQLGFLPEVCSGQVWRLFTPMFIHFGFAHILFNMLWLYRLGGMIEGRLSWRYLAVLVAGTALLSNLGQYLTNGPGFGGMSGVVYGLAGYVWIRGQCDRRSGLHLDVTNAVIMLIWLGVCYTGLVGPIANTAHVVGLVVGTIWGRIAAYCSASKPE